MRTRHALVILALAIGWLGACGNQIEVAPTEPGAAPAAAASSEAGASPEVRRLVTEIDSMLATGRVPERMLS